MTTRHDVSVICECGHQGTVVWRENDAPFSTQYEDYSIDGFEGKDYFIYGFTTVSEALQHMQPKCPSCGQVGKVKTRS